MDIDLGMGMNGLETANLIKHIRGYKNIPVVAVTAYAMLGDREKFIAAGCTEYLAKPFNRNALIELISRVLQN
jgi:CheY-like chemotaxis protein